MAMTLKPKSNPPVLTIEEIKNKFETEAVGDTKKRFRSVSRNGKKRWLKCIILEGGLL